MSCALKLTTGDGCPVQFKNQTSTPNSALTCKQECFKMGRHYSVLYNKARCFCGDEMIPTSENFPGDPSSLDFEGSFPAAHMMCPCQTSSMDSMHTGQTLCAKFYVSGAISAMPTIKLAPLSIYSTEENVVLSVSNDIAVNSYCWDFGDGTSQQCLQNGTSVGHNFALAGTYTVTLTLSEDTGTFVVNFPVTIQSKVRVSELLLDKYADVERELPLHAKITSGSEVQIQWSRFRPSDQTEYGKLINTF